MLPISILQTAVGHPILVELKNGETYNGHLESCDFAMNLLLREVIQTSVDGERFWRWAEMNVKGANIKYLRIPEPVLDKAREKSMETRNSGRGEDRDRAGGGDRDRPRKTRGRGANAGAGGGRGNSSSYGRGRGQ